MSDVSYSVHALAKEFAGVPAVVDATFEVATGTVHGVIGKNGAGKSVLMNMVAGVLRPSAGGMQIGNEVVDERRWSPRSASDLGVALVPQEPPDLPYLTVGDFLFLGDRRHVKAGIVQHKQIARAVAEIDERLELGVAPSDQMASLPIEVQQLLAFGKAVFLEEGRVILLDEITASLSGERREALIGQLRELRVGRSFTLISHRISEIMAACDTVTVMRDGVSVETVAVADTTPEALAAAIVGSADAEVHLDASIRDLGRPVIELRQVASAPRLAAIDLTVREREVIGLAGVEGSGKDELLEVIAGLRSYTGEIAIEDKVVTISSPRSAAKRGVAFLPKKREEFATIHGMSVLTNLVLPVASRLARRLGIVRTSRLREVGAPVATQMQVKAASIDVDIDTLSGGNKQKVMLGRLQLMEPLVYALNEPTRGVDISTIPEILRTIRERLSTSSAVLMTSESEDELLETCDRVFVFVHGEVVRIIERGAEDFTVGAIYRTGQGVGAA